MSCNCQICNCDQEEKDQMIYCDCCGNRINTELKYYTFRTDFYCSTECIFDAFGIEEVN